MKTHALHALAAMVAGAAAAPSPQIAPAVTQSNVRVGDGSPRQAYRYEQLTDSIHCGGEGNTCAISSMEVKTSSWSFDVGTGGSGGTSFAGWISGGFSVSESKSNGHTATCNAGNDGNSAQTCVWGRIAYTGYEVQRYEHRSNQNAEDGTKDGEPFYIWSPNDDAGHGYVCAHDDECWTNGDNWWGHKSDGDALWESDTNAGGPQPFVWGHDQENRWN